MLVFYIYEFWKVRILSLYEKLLQHFGQQLFKYRIFSNFSSIVADGV